LLEEGKARGMVGSGVRDQFRASDERATLAASFVLSVCITWISTLRPTWQASVACTRKRLKAGLAALYIAWFFTKRSSVLLNAQEPLNQMNYQTSQFVLLRQVVLAVKIVATNEM
jgi:hypothetical protein